MEPSLSCCGTRFLSPLALWVISGTQVLGTQGRCLHQLGGLPLQGQKVSFQGSLRSQGRRFCVAFTGVTQGWKHFFFCFCGGWGSVSPGWSERPGTVAEKGVC